MGELTAIGQSYIPTVAYAWINLTQVTMNESEETTAVADNPTAKAADENGSNKNVAGDDKMHLLHNSELDSQNFIPTYIHPS